MIIGFFYRGFLLFILMTILYFVLSWWSRSVRREKLAKTWDEEIKNGDRAAYIEKGLEDYDGSLRRKLILGVFVVPYLVIALLIYVVNFQ
ncbi:MAG: hypothetical protein ABJ327_20260 [Litoreibacter sp.]